MAEEKPKPKKPVVIVFCKWPGLVKGCEKRFLEKVGKFVSEKIAAYLVLIGPGPQPPENSLLLLTNQFLTNYVSPEFLAKGSKNEIFFCSNFLEPWRLSVISHFLKEKGITPELNDIFIFLDMGLSLPEVKREARMAFRGFEVHLEPHDFC